MSSAYDPQRDTSRPATDPDATAEWTPSAEQRTGYSAEGYQPTEAMSQPNPPADSANRPYRGGESGSQGYQQGGYAQEGYQPPTDQRWTPVAGGHDVAPAPADLDYDSVRARERDAFGGVKIGSAFFGWLTAVGATVVLVALVAAVVTALNLGTVINGQTAAQDVRSLGVAAIVTILAVLLVAYFCGGYVAGRMARFNGVRQGIAVWLWSVLIGAVLAGIGLVTNGGNDIAGQFNLPNAPLATGNFTTASWIAIGIVLGVTLVGAIMGGLTGMRFHRRVDRAGFEIEPEAY